MNRQTAMPDSPETALGCGPFALAAQEAHSLRLTIFERIRAEGSVSRATIAKDLAISPATVTTQTSALIDMGFIQEERVAQDTTETARGRPPIALKVEPRAHLVAGLKLSEREHTAVIFDFAGQRVASVTQPATSDTDVDKVIGATRALVLAVCAEADLSASDLSAIAVGLPGFINSSEGIVHWSPLIDARALNLAERLTEALSCTVLIENDANLIALAELWFGVGRQISDFAVVTIEHGVGMGLVVNHKLYSGARGMGMELGHTKVALDGALCRCGQRGCLEAYVADYALVREAALATRDPEPSSEIHEVLERLFAEAKGGNDTARSIFERAGRYLAMGLGNVTNLFDPQLIILSGERMKYDYLYSQKILQELQRYALNSGVPLPPIEVHAWGDLVWASGAAALALSHVTETRLAEQGAAG